MYKILSIREYNWGSYMEEHIWRIIHGRSYVKNYMWKIIYGKLYVGDYI